MKAAIQNEKCSFTSMPICVAHLHRQWFMVSDSLNNVIEPIKRFLWSDFLLACLFYESRRSRFVYGYPAESDMPYLQALAKVIENSRDKA